MENAFDFQYFFSFKAINSVNYYSIFSNIGTYVFLINLLFLIFLLFYIFKKRKELINQGKKEERNRISRDLHDTILSKLFSTRMSLGFLEVENNTKKEFENYLKELQNIEKEIRSISHELNQNNIVAEIGFYESVEQLIKRESKIGGFSFKIIQDKPINWSEVNRATKQHLYSVIQESLHNIIKHSSAKNVLFKISSANKKISVIVLDNGIGFDKRISKKGIGIYNMKSRIKEIGGAFKINSVLNKGTVVNVEFDV